MGRGEWSKELSIMRKSDVRKPDQLELKGGVYGGIEREESGLR